ISRRVEAVLHDLEANTVHLFWPLRGEVDLRALADRLRRRGRTVVLPVVTGPRRLEHRVLESRQAGEADADALVPGPWGLVEPPTTASLVTPADLEAVVVPGLAFGRDGTRLGMGGGYYDTFLTETDATRIGVAFQDAVLETVPVEAHDARVHIVVTDAETIQIR
ncbi:5-formyltetrahydrofolate cyclo-ligase, partial [Rubrivirga sp.]|uniref:5-formyltetrahydrofolate cyclo-ligase n=1 Tax=Rubrivirga sp. TaxID=1885344 RepID=UPI003C76B5D6